MYTDTTITLQTNAAPLEVCTQQHYTGPAKSTPVVWNLGLVMSCTRCNHGNGGEGTWDDSA